MRKKIVFKDVFFAAIAIDVVVILAIIVTKNLLPPVLPLFYGLPAGQTQLTSTYGFLIAPVTALLITILNLIVSLSVKDDFLKKVLAISAFAVSFLTVITVSKIIFLVGLF